MRVCAQCGHENPEGARFCNACAAPLAAEERAEVRKTVTVLFCDLVGSTSLGDRTDPELLRELMARYHAELRTILERHGGTVEKFVGDAAMAVFGIPHAHEDDALRALRAADEIREAVARLGLQARTGVNTGEVVAGHGETFVTGDAVNVAARLEQAADPGEVLLGQGTHALVRDAVRDEPIEPLALKGKDELVPAHRLLELLPDVPAFTRPIEAPFVGRNDELETLERTLARAVDERIPQLATIIGPPGIGKSRLARELIQLSEARVLVGRCLSYGEGITYWPLSEIVAQVGDVRSAFGDDSEAALAASRIAAAVGTNGASPEEIAWGFRKLFEALAREQPLIVVLDDIHWAEPTLLDLIEYISTFARQAPLCVLCTARPDLLQLRARWATPRPNVALVTLEPLAQEETETLVEELRELPEKTKARIVEAAEGNPLFVEQLVAMQAENGDGALEIPPTIQALLAARIDRLEPEERAVIEGASIEGRMFHRGSVVELVPKPVQASVGGHLMTLVRKELIRPDRAVLPGDDGFRFGHILIRDAAYDSIPKRLRAELHERFADWLDSRLGADASDEILGYHLERAHNYRVELALKDEHTKELALRAGRLLADSGRRAYARSDAAATCSLLGRATELLSDDHFELPPLLALLGLSKFDAGDVPGALETLRLAQVAAAAAGQRTVELHARMRELGARLGNDPDLDLAETLEEARATIEELTELDDAESLESAWDLVTDVAAIRGDFVLKEEAVANRIEIARKAGLHRQLWWAADHLCTVLAYGPTPVDEAIRRVEETSAEFAEPRPGQNMLATLYAYAGRDADAVELAEHDRRALLDLGLRMYYAAGSMDVGWIALLAGRPERAESALREGVDVLEAAGELGHLSTVAAVLAEVLYQLDRHDEAAEWTSRSRQATARDDLLSQALWRATRAKVLACRGEVDEALQLSAEAVEVARLYSSPPVTGDCLVSRAEVLTLLDRSDEVRLVLEEALAVYECKGIVPSIERTRALLAEIPA